MTDHERLGQQGAEYLKPQIDLALRHFGNHNLTELFHVLSRLDSVCHRALMPNEQKLSNKAPTVG